MADENRMITFEYAKANYDAYKKLTIPNTKECMTKAEILAHVNVDNTLLTSYTNNQLVPRVKVVGQFPFTVKASRSEIYIEKGTNSFQGGISIEYRGGTGKIYPPGTTVVPMTSAGGVANYSVSVLNLPGNTQVVSGSGTINLELYVTAWYSNDSFLVHIPIQADASGTPVATATITVGRFGL